tara:strand:+ start:44 stop:1396 length:1353 start_codon:yes stop_codon:yes gene_type:complete
MSSLTRLDLEFYEQVVIYNILTDETYLASIIDNLEEKFFSNDNIKSVIGIIKDFYSTRDAIPTITEVKAYLTTQDSKDKFRRVVEMIKNFDNNFNKDELYENTERFLKEKAVVNTLLETAKEIETGNIDTTEIFNRFDDACSVSIQPDKGLDYLNEVQRHIDDLHKQDSTVSTGFPWLDEKIDGGYLENGRAIYVFAGSTNVGKSIFLGNTAVNIASTGKTVLLVTLEMSEFVYAKRLSTNITQIPINDLAGNSDELESKLNDFKSTTGGRILIKEFPPSTITCSNLKAFIKKITDSGIKIDALVLDYVNLLTTNTAVNSYERVKYITERLRSLSYIFTCPVITATQLNRTGYNEVNPGLETVGESYGLAATADCMFNIWQEEEDAELGIIKLGMMKNRFGQNFGSCTLHIDYTTLSLSQGDEILAHDINTATADLSTDDTASIMNYLSD